MRLPITLLPILALMTAAEAVPPGTITEESAVPAYTLPDPLKCEDGTPVKDVATWEKLRRPELMKLFETQVYGKTPIGRPEKMKFVIRDEKTGARGGLATRLRVGVLFDGTVSGPQMEMLVYLPASASKASPAPLLWGPNFEGNYVTTEDPDIPLPTHWVPNSKGAEINDNKPSEKARGKGASRWAYDMALKRGYGVATVGYGEIDPDFDDGFKNGVHVLAPPTDDASWGTIGGWAWALSRGMDWFETEPRIDAKRVIVMGHSRLGKTSLWAGAQDQRFAMVISNDSGAGGAALSRRIFGETVQHLNDRFPHWFCRNYRRWNSNEAACPVDQHQLLALIAPRPLLVHSATEDQWADPRGEFLSATAASPVYGLYGHKGIVTRGFPVPDQPVGDCVGYFLRTGAHDVTDADWKSYLDFADRHLKR